MVTGQKIIPLIRNSPVTRFGIKVVADAVLAALAWAIAIVCLNTGAIAVFHPYERDPKPRKATAIGPDRAPSFFELPSQTCFFYAPAIAALRRDRLSFGSDRFFRTENNF